MLRLWFWPVLFTLCAAPVAADALDKEKLQTIQAATYEVVFKKPEKDSLSYEKPLPFDRLPYAIRSDKYVSVGTAFALGQNEFVSAAHVLIVGEPTQFGEPLLRDVTGNVYPVDQIVKYSQHRDFVVFTVKGTPSRIAYVANASSNKNANVHAVGNALGEGIVVRDGLYTSDTPEERAGEWAWMRFSAAASPGNSGGPLLDDDGNVVGVILRKSENENLNYALPIKEVLNAKVLADLDLDLYYVIDNTDKKEFGNFKREFRLPMSYGALKKELVSAQSSFGMTLMQRLFDNNKADLFPEGRGAEALLNSTDSDLFPKLIMQGNDGAWDTYKPKETYDGDLGHGGKVEYGQMRETWYLRVQKPDDVPLERFYADPKLFMDILLKGFPARRPVGPESVRITSLGRPEKDYIFTDRFERRWQVRVWAHEYDDTKVVVFSLPVPDGCIARLLPVRTKSEEDILRDMEAPSDFMAVSYYGTLSEWDAFLKQRQLLPAVFKDIALDVEYGKRVEYRSNRLKFTYGPDPMKITPDSDLELVFAYFRENGKVTWDVASVVAGEDKHTGTFFQVARTGRPPDTLGDEYRGRWKRVLKGETPYDRSASYADKKTFIAEVYPVKAEKTPDVLYTMMYGVEGNVTQDEMVGRLSRLSKAVSILEYSGSQSRQ